MTVGLWILERCANERFPYRLQILQGEEPWLTLRVQDRWPAANRNIFCLREKEPPEPGEVLEEIERLPVVALQRRGRRLSVVLDRNRYKRCDFLFLTKRYKGRLSEEYEQIFWQTQQSMRQRSPGTRLVTARSSRNFTVRIASEERYPWRFPGSTTARGRLPIGDSTELHSLFFEWLRGGLLSAVEIERAAAALGPMPFEERLRALDVLTAAIYTVSSHLPEPQREVLLNFALWFVYLVGQMSQQQTDQ